jgi:cytochrome o ubiquinol oxidase subunit 2
MKNTPAIYRLADPDLFRSIATQKIPPSPGAPSGVIGAALPGVADVR